MRDPYSVLGVRRNADADEIKAAWRSKAKTIHPDHNRDDPDATDRFAEVGQAYEVLKDPERRRRYDRTAEMNQTIMQQREAAERAKAARANAEKVMEELARAQAARAQADAAKAKSRGGKKESESPEETIERIFGVAPETREQARDEAEAAADQPAAEPAEDTVAEPRTPLPLMAVDLISNLVRRLRRTAPLPEKAPDLSVDAKVTISDLLAQKPVAIRLSDDREVRVPVDPGSTDGTVVRLKGQGLKLPGMKQGDLLVTLKAERDDRLSVRDFDLHAILQISLQDAVLGGEAIVETPDGPFSVTIPSWSGSDQSVTLSGFGLHNDAGGRGDLVVELRIVLWEKPDAKVTDLMRHMRDGLYI